ncbi:BQ5605_C002g01166 [Microbotryum silenes-dioicae]|uniref:BQ5605_C002g01166 protein n=1 Tax=Microbotryum silenes-dioicae TaxID=796604 RepID=A0A2X0LXW4_9BASI|nr:BQ5605_C002g01166 [Microbotryum silenes-dioicae]
MVTAAGSSPSTSRLTSPVRSPTAASVRSTTVVQRELGPPRVPAQAAVAGADERLGRPLAFGEPGPEVTSSTSQVTEAQVGRVGQVEQAASHVPSAPPPAPTFAPTSALDPASIVSTSTSVIPATLHPPSATQADGSSEASSSRRERSKSSASRAPRIVPLPIRNGRSEPGGRLVLDKFAVYETNLVCRRGLLTGISCLGSGQKIYIIACNQSDSRYRVLKIDRATSSPSMTVAPIAFSSAPNPILTTNSTATTTSEDSSEPSAADPSKKGKAARMTEEAKEGLVITEDETIYSRDEIELLKETLSAGNAGGLRKVDGTFYGIVGFIRFTDPYYIVLIKRRQHVALIGGHYIYHCEEVVLRPITSSAVTTRSTEEARRIHAFQGVDLSKNFYFSYTYDVTHTLQHNLTRSGGPSLNVDGGGRNDPLTTYNDKWVWNRFLLTPAFAHLKQDSPWVLPLIHGFVDQAKLSVFGRTIYITLIARRSRHFAGARFLKRGANEQGYVANDVETEQIVSDALTTSFHSPSAATHQHPATGESHQNRRPNPRFTSFVQVRGSIPLFWSQESTNMSPKPPIECELTIVDPYFTAAALHFDDLLGRYGGPITILNLIKQKERTPRESKLLPEFKQCIDYLNQFLPDEHKIEYIAWDLAAANKRRDKDVIGVLEDIAEESLAKTKFFHTGPEPTWFKIHPDASHPMEYRSTPLLQSGVVRTNCIDCLDRTNAAQFVIAKAALGHQLHALGIIDYPRVPFESDAVNMIMEMFHDHGDTVALQYGGSHLVNTMETYRGIAQWTSHSRDIVNNLRRYYTNSFVDADKQAAIDVFLGIEAPVAHQPPLSYSQTKNRRSYRNWYTPEHFKASLTPSEAERRLKATVEDDDASGSANYWQAFYRPQLLTQFDKHFAVIMNSTSRYLKAAALISDGPDASPFVARHALNVAQHRSVRLHYFIDELWANPLHQLYDSLRLQNPSKLSRPRSGTRGAGVGGSRPASSLRSRIEAQRIDEASSTTGTTRTRNSSTQAQSHGQRSSSSLGVVAVPSHVAAVPSVVGPGGAVAPVTEALVHRLLEPRVEPIEAREYTSWVEQFQHLSLAQELSHKDARLYEEHAGLAGQPLSAVLTSSMGHDPRFEQWREDDRGGGGGGSDDRDELGSWMDNQGVRLRVDSANVLLYEDMVRRSRPVAMMAG